LDIYLRKILTSSTQHLNFLHQLESSDALSIVAIIGGASLCAIAIRWLLRQIAENARPSVRLNILRIIPLARLAIGIAALTLLIPTLIEPSFQNVIALLASASLVLAFVLKDYASSLVAGLVTILENPYQPGDWIEMDGVYGEVKSISLRAVHLVTADDNLVMIPHYRFWSKKISNATNGSHSLLCIANFYLHPDHDGHAVQRCLLAIGENSPLRQLGTKLGVVAQEKPWGTHYKLKAYVNESRDQFQFITDLTIRGKEDLRAMNIRFAHAIPAIGESK
jgi:small conductance mechanosensitive channel